jgi:hypothetical protein
VEHPAYKNDRLFYLKWQLENINNIKSSIKDYIFVFNSYYEQNKLGPILEDPLLLEAVALIRAHHGVSQDYTFQALARHNVDGSYGAWNEALAANRLKFDYSVLLEDDYMPGVDDYDKKFMEFFEEDTVYVCTEYKAREKNVESHYHQAHCAQSNGMINNRIYDEHFDRRGGFNLCGARANYGQIEWNQIHYLDKYKEHKVKDVLGKYSAPFLEADSRRIYRVGNPNGESLVVPIYPPYVG